VRLLKWSLIPWLLMCWLVSGAAYAVIAPPPPCLPKVQFPLAAVTAPIPPGVSTRYDTYSVWICNLPNGYNVNAWLYTMPAVSTGPELRSRSLDQSAGRCGLRDHLCRSDAE
jgi:hypothetical protein